MIKSVVSTTEDLMFSVLKEARFHFCNLRLSLRSQYSIYYSMYENCRGFTKFSQRLVLVSKVFVLSLNGLYRPNRISIKTVICLFSV